MQALAVAGDFGFSERDVDTDTIEVTYRGADVRVSSTSPRDDSRVTAEKEKVHDLALLRAARIAEERGVPAIRIISEKTDSDVDVQSYPRCRPSPFWGSPGFWGNRRYRYGYGYNDFYGDWPGDYDCSELRSATGKATAVLVVDLLSEPGTTDHALNTKDTIARLEKIYAGATYQ